MPAIVAVGLLARFGLGGGAADFAGGVAYTALVYVLIALIWPRVPAPTVGLAAFACSAAVELLQATGAAAALVDLWSPLRLALGTSFVATDFIAYAAGAAVAAAVDVHVARRNSAAVETEGRPPGATTSRPRPD